MTSLMKYIVIDTGRGIGAYCFPGWENHSDHANGYTVLGAGEVGVEDGRFRCFGQSFTLGVKSRGDEDAEIIERLMRVRG